MKNGMERGRYKIEDLATTLSFTNGALTGMISAIENKENVEQIIDTTVELILRVFGVDADEAAWLVRQPLNINCHAFAE